MKYAAPSEGSIKYSNVHKPRRLAARAMASEASVIAFRVVASTPKAGANSMSF